MRINKNEQVNKAGHHNTTNKTNNVQHAQHVAGISPSS